VRITLSPAVRDAAGAPSSTRGPLARSRGEGGPKRSRSPGSSTHDDAGVGGAVRRSGQRGSRDRGRGDTPSHDRHGCRRRHQQRRQKGKRDSASSEKARASEAVKRLLPSDISTTLMKEEGWPAPRAAGGPASSRRQPEPEPATRRRDRDERARLVAANAQQATGGWCARPRCRTCCLRRQHRGRSAGWRDRPGLGGAGFRLLAGGAVAEAQGVRRERRGPCVSTSC
jgi:hypothetical protein